MIVRPMIVRLMMVVRLSGHPLIQDSLTIILAFTNGLHNVKMKDELVIH